MYENARSALARLLAHVRAEVLWLPAYVCAEVAEAAQAVDVEPRYYGVDAALEPDCAALEAGMRAGDCVLGIDFFGALPGPRFRRLAAKRRDILWIEDRAQALAPGPPWGDWLLYSPRKLLGVPDGGIIVAARRSEIPKSPAPKLHMPALLDAQTLRSIGGARKVRKDWFVLYQRSEARQRVTQKPMSAITFAQLGAADAATLAARRLDNYRILAATLRSVGLFSQRSIAAPFGFPIRVAAGERLCERLCRMGIYAQRHWARLPSSRRQFPFEHRLAAELITLPCDQRYGADEMQAVGAAVRRLL